MALLANFLSAVSRSKTMRGINPAVEQRLIWKDWLAILIYQVQCFLLILEDEEKTFEVGVLLIVIYTLYFKLNYIFLQSLNIY